MAPTSRKSAAAEDEGDSDFDYSDEEGAIRVEDIYIPPPPVPYCSVENKGPRLIIHNISNHFFKSYAHKVVLGPFHKSFNAIVGPNGSGKSNVIDSMLFVFGYRAQKIRSKKLSVLLHNSKKHTNVTSATVTVHFALIVDVDDDNYDVVSGSEFTVSRTVNKDNSSYYTINQRKVQFKEVGQLLKKHGIDLKYNRFLILQGEVEQIAMMPSKGNGNDAGMLEYLEDIVGTTRYKEPLAKLSTRVELYKDQRSEKLNRLRIVQDEVETLRGPMQEAVEFLILENNIMHKKNMFYQYNIYAIKENSKEVIAEKNEVDGKIKELCDKLAGIGREKQVKEEGLKDCMKRYTSDVKRMQSLKIAYDGANSKNVKNFEEIKQLNKDRHSKQDQLAKEKQKQEDFQKQPEELMAKIPDCEKNIEKYTNKRDKLVTEKEHLLANMKDLTKDLQAKKNKLTEELSPLMEAVTETKTAFTLAESDLNMYTNESTAAKAKLEQLKQMHAQTKDRMGLLQGEIKKLHSLIPEKENTLKSAQTELADIKGQEGNMMNNLQSARSKVEISRSAMNASHGRNRILDSLMQQKSEGNCPGLFGRLGDLGAIDAKYDVAISTACGPLDFLLVDSPKTGEWCIDYLKRNDIGRTSLIALDMQNHLLDQCNSKIRTPENAPRLFDLIKTTDDRVRPAFYYALRDTLVANELEQATRIAYGEQRYRVVTLRGDMIEIAGAMSGGGNRVDRGRMGQSVRVDVDPQEIAAMEQEMAVCEEDVRRLRQRQNELEVAVARLQPEVKQMKGALEKMKIELAGLNEREPVAAQQVQNQTQKLRRISINPNAVKKLEEDVANKKAKFEEMSQTASVVQTKVDAITAEIKEKSQGKLQKVEKEINELNKNIDKMRAEITRLTVAARTAERNGEKSLKNIAGLQTDIKSLEEAMLAKNQSKVELEADIEKLLKLIEEYTATAEEAKIQGDEIKDNVKQFVKAETELKSQKIDIDQQAKKLQEELNATEDKIHTFRVKISTLKLQDVPDTVVEPLKQYTEEEIEGWNMENALTELQALEVQLKGINVNLATIEEYRRKMKIVISRSKELDEVAEKFKQMRDHYDNLRARRKEEFLSGFRIIRQKLKEMYQMITIGGDADFELVDTYDPFSEGIQFRVRPPKKTWKLISNLSGGEKTLSSLALVFALHYYKPSPLYVMDEIDAALDFKNVSIIGNYIKERTKNAQFIIISLRSNMFELANHLIGIYKTYDCTKSVAIDPRLYDAPKAKVVLIEAEVLAAKENDNASQDLFGTQSNGTQNAEDANDSNSTDIIPNSDEPANQDVSEDIIPNTGEMANEEDTEDFIPNTGETAKNFDASSEDIFVSAESDIIPGTQESERMEVDS